MPVDCPCRSNGLRSISRQPIYIANGKMGMSIVGLADKAVAESRERVQAALHACGYCQW